VAGRGRLYRRAKARGAALSALRAAALSRLRPAFGLPSDAAARVVADAVAAGTGRDSDEVWSILYGADPDDDEALVRAVDALDTLMSQVVHVRPSTMEGGA
jgi:hypothetical protein